MPRQHVGTAPATVPGRSARAALAAGFMPGRDKNRAATADDADDDVAGAPGGQRCSCLPFCFLGGRGAASGGSGAARGRRRRRRFMNRLSWFSSWPWLQKSGKKEADGDSKKKKGTKRRGRRMLLLLTTSLQAKKALASVVSGNSTLLPAKVSSFSDAKKENNRKPRPTADDNASSGTRQPQAATAATSTRGSTAPALARQETSQPCPRPTDEPPAASRVWRAPLRRHSLHQPDHTERPAGAGGLWTAATTLGVIVLFGRVTAVVFLCSCLYGTRFVRSRVTGASASAKAKSSGGSSSSRRFGDPVGVAAEKAVELSTTEECKKVVMAGLLERADKRPSSRFGR
ncbi:uncharacterized protein LOC133907319 [Phragmites australis]|uniref:uncharacterized protein LOC133907319 n=1 Tax=Phragmites australis TaxID=29695 RepID=UPI002D779DA2|nr:uncharacterized protein LOC133907319 [Phragmites australis]